MTINWVDIKKQLPKYGQKVYLVIRNNKGFLLQIIAYLAENNNFFDVSSGKKITYDIICWHPLFDFPIINDNGKIENLYECTKCKEVKPESSFYFRKSRSGKNIKPVRIKICRACLSKKVIENRKKEKKAKVIKEVYRPNYVINELKIR